jgi:hypothetical protein
MTYMLYYVNSIILITNHDHYVKQNSLNLQPFFFAIGAERPTSNAYTGDYLVCGVPIPGSFVADRPGECRKTKMDAKNSIFRACKIRFFSKPISTQKYDRCMSCLGSVPPPPSAL